MAGRARREPRRRNASGERGARPREKRRGRPALGGRGDALGAGACLMRAQESGTRAVPILRAWVGNGACKDSPCFKGSCSLRAMGFSLPEEAAQDRS